MAKREMLRDQEAECVVGGNTRPQFIFTSSDITLGRGVSGSGLDRGVNGVEMLGNFRSQGFLGVTREDKQTFYQSFERGFDK